jgi:hypothetical protein
VDFGQKATGAVSLTARRTFAGADSSVRVLGLMAVLKDGSVASEALSSVVPEPSSPVVAWKEASGSARKAGVASAQVSNATGVEIGLKDSSRSTTVPWKAPAALPLAD